MTPTVTTALISAGVSVVVSIVGSFSTFQVQRSRLRAELRTEFMAEEAIQQLLNVEGWEQRSFEVIQRHIGGFDDDELRRLLVRAGALRFRGQDGKELWGLRRKNSHLLAGKPSKPNL